MSSRVVSFFLLLMIIFAATPFNVIAQQRQIGVDQSIVGKAPDGLPIILVPYNEAIMRVDRDLKEATNQLRVERKGGRAVIRLKDEDSLSSLDTEELLSAMDRAIELSKKSDSPDHKYVSTHELVTPVQVIGSLTAFQPVLDEILNQAGAFATSQMFAMRTHLAATIADLNVVFKNNMDDLYDKLSAAQKEALSRAQVMLTDMQRSLLELQQRTFESVANLLCDSSAMLANFPVKLVSLNLLRKKVSPDIICLLSPEVRDKGTLHEQLLRFRGVNLNAEEEYPQATLTIPSQPQFNFSLSTAGGNSILLMPLPGGLNGSYNDTSLRGDLVAKIDFSWGKTNKMRRWFFILRPFIVRSIHVSITPLIEQTSYSTKTDSCYVNSEGGIKGGKEQRRTCLITVDKGAETVSCANSEPTTQNSDSGIAEGPLQGPGSCTWVIRAKSSRFGAGAWYGMFTYLNQKSKSRFLGPTYHESFILNQGNTGQVVTYPANLIPRDARPIEAGWQYTVTIIDNTGNRFVLTESNPSDSRIGHATLDQTNGKITLDLTAAIAANLFQ